MKSLVPSMICGLFLSGAAVNGWAKNPQQEDPKVITSAVAAVTKGHGNVRIVPSGNGFSIYTDKGTGSMVESGSGYTIYYGGKARSVVKTSSGWTIYGN